MRLRPALLITLAVLFLIWLIWRSRHAVPTVQTPAAADSSPTAVPHVLDNSDLSPTNVYAHNLMLRKGPNFRIYVRWLRGEMDPAHRGVNPSFDDPESFFLNVKAGVIRANIGDLSYFLNAGAAHSPLKNIRLSGDGNRIKLNGTLHKLVSLPIEMVGEISTAPNNRIRVHVTKLSVLKIPFKGFLGRFNVSIADLFNPKGMPGIQVSNNDILFDPQALFPPPHIRGQLASVRVVNPDLEEIYGNAQSDVNRVQQWRNFVRLRGGTLDFGKLTMHHVDLMMIDISDDAWFDLDLANYQAQLVNGYTRMTPQAGLQIFMPDLDEVQKKKSKNVSIEWFKNRNVSPPPDVVSK